MTLADYHALVRELVRGSALPPCGPGDPRVYASLVRAQHRQPLTQVYGPAVERAGGDVLRPLFDLFLEACPPREVHPGRWAVRFADWLGGRADLPLRLREHVDFLALRLAQSLELDEPSAPGTAGEVRAYTHDPREAGSSRPVVILVFRDGTGQVRVLDASGPMVGAWGLACARCDAAELELRGLKKSVVLEGVRRLADAGHPLFAHDSPTRRVLSGS